MTQIVEFPFVMGFFIPTHEFRTNQKDMELITILNTQQYTSIHISALYIRTRSESKYIM